MDILRWRRRDRLLRVDFAILGLFLFHFFPPFLCISFFLRAFFSYLSEAKSLVSAFFPGVPASGLGKGVGGFHHCTNYERWEGAFFSGMRIHTSSLLESLRYKSLEWWVGFCKAWPFFFFLLSISRAYIFQQGILGLGGEEAKTGIGSSLHLHRLRMGLIVPGFGGSVLYCTDRWVYEKWRGRRDWMQVNKMVGLALWLLCLEAWWLRHICGLVGTQKEC